MELWSGNIKSLFTEDSNPVIYQREIEVESEVYADIAILYEKDYNQLRMVVNKEAETCFVLDSKRECSRYLSGFLMVNHKVKVYYTIETWCGYTE